MSKKPPKQPTLDLYADTPYITRNRELNTTVYGDLNEALDNYRNWQNNNDLWQSVADQYTQSQWNDLNRQYQQALNQNAQRERQRLGTYGASSSLYHSDTLQRAYNDMAANIASNTANAYNKLLNQEYLRRANDVNNYNYLFNQTGNVTEGVDRLNWQTKNQNKIIDWQNDMIDYQYNPWNRFTSGLKGAIGGGITGLSTGNPWLGLAGAAVGGVGGALSSDAINSNQSLGTGALLGGGAASLYNQYLQNRATQNANNITGTPYQDWLAGDSYRGGLGSYGLTTSNLQDTLSNSELYNRLRGYY